MNNNYRYENRKFVIVGVVITIVLVYIVRLFNLQILSDEYKEYADSNAFLYKTVYPSRGVMYDRTGKLLVSNQPAYDVMVCMRKVKDLDTLAFCQSLGITREFFDKRMADVKNRRLNPGYSSYTDQLFLSQLTAEDFAMFQEQLYKFEGFSIQRRAIRQYNYPVAGHLFGDLGEVSKKNIADDDYYVQGDFIGKQGIESFYEKYLRGKKGKEVLLRDAYGRVQGHFQDGAKDEAPVPGKNLTLSIDIELQALAERLLQNKIGSVVAIEPSTGEVLCLASSPTFNPQLLTGRQRGENHRLLSLDKQKPLLNRAIQGTYPPGSTFKTSQALTYLQEGIITPETLFPCAHGFRFKGLHVGCHPHGSPIALVPSLATSCNSYFCWGLYRMIGSEQYSSSQEALTRWKDHMVSMGFGYRLGIDLPGEARGFIPNSAFYDKWYGGRWNGLTVISISIGQGEVTLTPLQIANLGATIANRGYYIAPHVVKGIQGESIDSLYTTPKYTMVDKHHYETVVEGMRDAVLNGTCRAADLPGFEVCGKTGTAQNRGKDHSAFMGFAPMHDPKIAVAVYVENGGFGAVYGVPIGALIMEKYLTGTLSEESEKKANDIQQRVIYYGNQER
ncbi:MAG: penicillin-binding protein 2 [Bacteroidaceae bacterium]|nr:penicillin-binding protein 2 [Bacteroidaceae bacterium]